MGIIKWGSQFMICIPDPFFIGIRAIKWVAFKSLCLWSAVRWVCILAQAILAQAILLLYPLPPLSCAPLQAPQIIDSPHNQPSTPPTQSCRPLGGRTLVNDIRGSGILRWTWPFEMFPLWPPTPSSLASQWVGTRPRKCTAL